MVRNLVGGLAKVGLGRMTVEEFHQVLAARSRTDAPNTAPAHGLYLVEVNYSRMMHNVEPVSPEQETVESPDE